MRDSWASSSPRVPTNPLPVTLTGLSARYQSMVPSHRELLPIEKPLYRNTFQVLWLYEITEIICCVSLEGTASNCLWKISRAVTERKVRQSNWEDSIGLWSMQWHRTLFIMSDDSDHRIRSNMVRDLPTATRASQIQNCRLTQIIITSLQMKSRKSWMLWDSEQEKYFQYKLQ